MKILLGVPHNGTIAWQTGQAVWQCSAEHDIQVSSLPSSLLAMSFNILYADALNRNEAGDGVDCFGMLHADLAAEGYWMDTLVRVMEERQVDFVSAINAIKDIRKLTSSGVALPGQPWRPWKRFTMRELCQWPKTFNAEDIGFGDCVLLHNTGCWLADLRKPLFHQEDENGQLKAFFTINDRITRWDGKWRAEVEPEDWFFSRRLHELGAKTVVTREVVTHHFGMAESDNQTDSGTYDTDVDVANEWAQAIKESLNVRA